MDQNELFMPENFLTEIEDYLLISIFMCGYSEQESISLNI